LVGLADGTNSCKTAQEKVGLMHSRTETLQQD